MRFKTLLLLLVIASPVHAWDCFAEAGFGTWTGFSKLELPGVTPAKFDMYCTKQNVSFGWTHHSDLMRGKPFNKKADFSMDMFFMSYKVKLF
jgi:hypothetical protein